MKRRRFVGVGILFGSCALAIAQSAHADVPLGGFTPFVGIGLTKEFKTDDSDTFFIADPKSTWGTSPLGTGGNPYFDIALLDTGSAAHIITTEAVSNFGTHVGYTGNTDGFAGTNVQPIYGATGEIDMSITDPLGVYAEGLSHRTNTGNTLALDIAPSTTAMRGQTSISILEAPSAWKLPNVIGLPMAAQHGIVIRNSQPQIFQMDIDQGDAAHTKVTRTVRTPDVNFIQLGTGSQQGITRRTALSLQPSASFLAGPVYSPGLDLGGIGGGGSGFNLQENPQSPSVVDSGGLYVEVNMTNGTKSVTNRQFLLDTGADLTVFSDVFAAKLGIDVTTRAPDFHLEVEGSGGVVPGVPGYYVDNFTIDAVGGPVVLNHVPVAVLNVPNPTEPANDIDAILGMHLFTGRDLVIDAVPSATGNGASPRLYISDPVTQSHTWAAPSASGNWATAASWTSASTAPTNLWIADVRNTTVSDKTAVVSANSTVFQMNVTADSTGRMIVDVQGGATLTTFGEARIDGGGTILLESNATLDAQFVNIQGGTLAGSGSIFVGTGPVNGVVRNLAGRVTPGGLGHAIGKLSITGDFSNLGDGTFAIDLAGTTPTTQYDQLTASRSAYLGGTLEVSLVGYTPAVNASFTILSLLAGGGGSISGQFDHLSLPAGYQWNVAYNPASVVLTVVGLGLTGDFNSDGKVDAADYLVWRKTGGSAQSYLDWRTHFGLPGSGSGSAGNLTSVPEPCSLLLIAIAAGLLATHRRRVNFQTARS